MWEPSEIRLLRKAWPRGISTQAVANRLNRGRLGVIKKASVLGIVWGHKPSRLGRAPTQTELLRAFAYDPHTGIISHKLARRIGSWSCAPGECAGWIGSGYRRISFNGREYPATTLIWVMMTGSWPKHEIDHIDTYGPKADFGNRWSNLRQATDAQNAWNSRRRSTNKSGYAGVYWSSQAGKWKARITRGQVNHHLGYFTDLEQAATVRREAEIRLYGEFAPSCVTVCNDMDRRSFR